MERKNLPIDPAPDCSYDGFRLVAASAANPRHFSQVRRSKLQFPGFQSRDRSKPCEKQEESTTIRPEEGRPCQLTREGFFLANLANPGNRSDRSQVLRFVAYLVPPDGSRGSAKIFFSAQPCLPRKQTRYLA
jgi:hypothetical protein